jgi:pSer/pThr/pTyr-binding forkhead associated (FHA) protein
MLFTTHSSRRRKNLVMQNAEEATVFEVGSDEQLPLSLVSPAGEIELQRRFAADCGVPDGLKVVVDAGNGRAREHVLASPFALIGAAPGCAVRLDTPGVADRHAFMLVLEGRVFGCDLATPAGTRHEGRLITKAWLQGRPALEIAAATVTIADLQAPGGEGAVAADTDGVELELAFGNSRQAYRVRDALLLFGRDARCKLQYRHDSVSPVHGAIVCTRNTAWLVDLGSPEGVILDGVAVRLAPLHDGSILTIGDKDVEVRLLNGPEPPATKAAPQAGAVSEGFVLEVLERFQDSQRQLLDEMRTWTRDFSQALIEAQHSQSQQLQGERQEMRREFVELMRIMAQRLPGPGGQTARGNAAPQPDQRLPAPPKQLPAPPVARTADPEERLASTQEPEELRRKLQEVEQQLDAQQGWLGSLLRRSPR